MTATNPYTEVIGRTDIEVAADLIVVLADRRLLRVTNNAALRDLVTSLGIPFSAMTSALRRKERSIPLRFEGNMVVDTKTIAAPDPGPKSSSPTETPSAPAGDEQQPAQTPASHRHPAPAKTGKAGRTPTKSYGAATARRAAKTDTPVEAKWRRNYSPDGTKKRCGICKEFLPLDAYKPKNANKPDELRFACEACYGPYQANRYLTVEERNNLDLILTTIAKTGDACIGTPCPKCLLTIDAGQTIAFLAANPVHEACMAKDEAN